MHPVCVADTFLARYRIVHKLGPGSFSTTRLARDERLGRYVAIKVRTYDSDPKEVNTMTRLVNQTVIHNGRSNELIAPVLKSLSRRRSK